MTLIDIIKVLDEDTKIVVKLKNDEEIFQGEAGDTLVELTPEELELVVTNMWYSRSYYNALVIVVE